MSEGEPISQYRAGQKWREMYEGDSLAKNPFTRDIREGFGDTIDPSISTDSAPNLTSSDPNFIRDQRELESGND